MTKEQERLMSEAKITMLRQLPYFGTFVIGTPLIENNNQPTAMTDYRSIMFNSAWLLGGADGKPLRPRSEVVFVLSHEVLHKSFKHGIRLGFRDPSLFNVAADYAINIILHDGEVGTMPENETDPKTGVPYPKLLDEKYRGMSAETIYDLLEKERKKQGNGDKLKVNGIVIDLRKGDPGGTGGFEKPMNMDGSELTDAQRHELERDIDAKTSSSAAAAKSVGKLPAGLELFIHSALKPIIDWRDRLRQFVAKQIPSDYSWARPQRRHIWNDLYLPHITKSGVGKILVVMDTSGSVDYGSPESEGAQYFSEIRAIFEDVSPERLDVMYVDAAVAGHDIFEHGEEPVLRPRGGGGTDFRPPFELVKKLGLDIQCAIYLSDGYGVWGDPPPFPTLWVLTSDVKSPFGETIPLQR